MSEIKLSQEFLDKVTNRFQNLKSKAENAIAQIHDDKELYWLPDGESNSIAILVKHLSGNMRSRWTNIFEEDGEKPDRKRPTEFDQEFQPNRDELIDLWNTGWNYLFEALELVKTENLLREIYIRKEPHTIVFAILRQLTHYAEHVGQIVFLAKQIEWKNWKSLSIPREKEIFDYKEL